MFSSLLFVLHEAQISIYIRKQSDNLEKKEREPGLQSPLQAEVQEFKVILSLGYRRPCLQRKRQRSREACKFSSPLRVRPSDPIPSDFANSAQELKTSRMPPHVTHGKEQHRGGGHMVQESGLPRSRTHAGEEPTLSN